MKIELRRDYLEERWSIISFKRSIRPKEYVQESKEEHVKKCPFCPGNEEMANEIGRFEEKGKWEVRWVWNKYPALEPSGKPKRKKKGILTEMDGFGYHEIVVETPIHDKCLHELSDKHIFKLFKVYQQRFAELTKKPGIKYVTLFKNYGPKSGASIIHDHSQIIAQPIVPSYVLQKVSAIRSKKRAWKECPICKILQDESRSKRRVFQDKHFVSFVPFAPRFSGEVWLVPKRHVKSLTQLKDEELLSLVKMLKRILKGLMEISDSYNYMFFYSPKGADMHFHIEISPRTSIWGGYEFATNNQIISVPPEESAKFYRSNG